MVFKASPDGGGLEEDAQMELDQCGHPAADSVECHHQKRTCCADDILQAVEGMLVEAVRRYHAEHAAGGEILEHIKPDVLSYNPFLGALALSHQRNRISQVEVIHPSHRTVGGRRGWKWRQLRRLLIHHHHHHHHHQKGTTPSIKYNSLLYPLRPGLVVHLRGTGQRHGSLARHPGRCRNDTTAPNVPR